MSLEAIRWQRDTAQLQIIDQLLLPQDSKYISIHNCQDGWNVINKMQVRGAPAISIVGCLSLAMELSCKRNNKSNEDVNDLLKFVEDKLHFLVTARPTAINMKKACHNLCAYGNQMKNDSSINKEIFIEKIIDWCSLLFEEDISINKNLSKHGVQSILLKWSPDIKLRVLTHCNTGSLATAGYGTALGVIRCLQEMNKLDHVYCTETRPYNQGARLTAYELVYEKIPSTLICDSMVGALMKIIGCHAVLVGADCVTRNGDTANKIGTYQIAVIAKYHNVPFYVCAPTSSIDLTLESGEDIPIEERPAHEMTSIGGKRIAAEGINCWNPAFDVTPAELITGGIITEKGVFKPEDLCHSIS